MQCALTKLAYLLSKPEFTVKQIRDLMGMPLRGELTRASAVPASSVAGQDRLDHNMENIQQVLSQFMRLTRPPSSVPSITFSPDPVDTNSSKAAAPWTWTAAEAASTEAVLYPFLMHLAAARDDVETLSFCLRTVEPGVENAIGSPAAEGLKSHGLMAGGVVNSLEPGSGRSPLHIAALNGHVKSVNLLMQSGALVHLRDAMGHTALYYVGFLNPSDLDVFLTASFRPLAKVTNRPLTLCSKLVHHSAGQMVASPSSLPEKRLKTTTKMS